jgi:hypothetical protein
MKIEGNQNTVSEKNLHLMSFHGKTEMKRTQLIQFHGTTPTLRNIQNFQIKMLIDAFLDGMNQHNQAMITYREQCRQLISDRFELNKNDDEILNQNNSIVSIIEVRISSLFIINDRFILCIYL